jgi:hypothetical protein
MTLTFTPRPSGSSPLRAAGFIYPPFSPTIDGKPPDIGAYQHTDQDPWVPGCTLPTCDEYLDPARSSVSKSDDAATEATESAATTR